MNNRMEQLGKRMECVERAVKTKGPDRTGQAGGRAINGAAGTSARGRR